MPRNAGIPDIENMMTLSGLFGISIDELLSNEKEISRIIIFMRVSRNMTLRSGNKIKRHYAALPCDGSYRLL
jgi:hypothetical protein